MNVLCIVIAILLVSVLATLNGCDVNGQHDCLRNNRFIKNGTLLDIGLGFIRVLNQKTAVAQQKVIELLCSNVESEADCWRKHIHCLQSKGDNLTASLPTSVNVRKSAEIFCNGNKVFFNNFKCVNWDTYVNDEAKCKAWSLEYYESLWRLQRVLYRDEITCRAFGPTYRCVLYSPSLETCSTEMITLQETVMKTILPDSCARYL